MSEIPKTGCNLPELPGMDKLPQRSPFQGLKNLFPDITNAKLNIGPAASMQQMAKPPSVPGTQQVPGLIGSKNG